MGFFNTKKAENIPTSISPEQSKEIRLSEVITSSIGSVSQSTNTSADAKDEGRMRVVVRIRPFNSIEKQSKINQTPTVRSNNDDKTLQIYNSDGKISAMSFNRVYNEASSQQEFFETSGAAELISQALKGFTATIFAFGQTGSGKTFTITGPSDQISTSDTVGLVPRGLDFMFSQVKAQTEAKEISSVRVQASYLEIYNENVLDLLNPQNSGLPVRWSADRGFFVERLYIVDCDSLDDCLAVLEEGLRNRTTGSHAINEHSSRSHSLLTIYLEIQGTDEHNNLQHRYGKLNFVDLAGSEKVKESRTTLDTFAEALSINKSLLTLGKCISALADPKYRGKHIPYRDSKLTKLLADSLNGKGLALMIACISPSYQNLNETLKTVRYAIQARKITNKAVIQLDPEEELINNFKTEIQILKAENAKLKDILSKDPKYAEILNSINFATAEEKQRRITSRPDSPRALRSRATSHRERKKSIAVPSIETRSSRSIEQTKIYESHSRKSTMNTSLNVRKSLPNALPQRLSHVSKNPKSAAKQRIDELRRSVAPAGKEDSYSRSESSIKGSRRKSNIPDSESPTKARPNADLKPEVANTIPSLPEKRKKTLVRPSPREKGPVIDEPEVFSEKPKVEKLVQNRHRTLKEVGDIEKEIANFRQTPKKNLNKGR